MGAGRLGSIPSSPTMSKEKTTMFPKTVEQKQDAITRLFTELGLDIEKTNPNILRKLRLLNERTKTFEDEQKAIQIARALFDFYQNRYPAESFSESEQKTVLVGTAFTDIGKTGPVNATPEEEELVLDIYGVENIIQPEKITVREFLTSFLPENIEKKLSVLEGIGINPDVTMRQFYNMHSRWTLEIISGDGVPLEAVAAAAAHHLLEGVNPDDIIGNDSRFTRYFGENVAFDRAEKLIIILDKYDAARRRSGKNHKEAIEFVKNRIKSNPNFTEDGEFEKLLDNMDAMISANSDIYPERNKTP